MPGELSGGMQKRVGLARAIVTAPRYVLYDEPTAGLDPVTSRTIDRLVNRLRSELSVTSVVVTHDLLGALAVATRIALLHDGRIQVVCEPAAFVASDNPTVRRFLDAQRITPDAVEQDAEDA
jgi:phospholipid/cholesterol/gamma-HCH transport system ATP-binding protein